MKNKSKVDWLSILLIAVLLFNTIISVFLYVEEPESYNLIKLILCPTCLLCYVSFLIWLKLYQSKNFIIVYDDFFEICNKSIFDAKFVCERKNVRYVKYGATGKKEKKYLLSCDEITIDFGLIEIDEKRKLMVIYKISNIGYNFYLLFKESKDKAKEHYYANNEISPLKDENIVYKNKRNAFQIKKVNNQYIVSRYRHYAPIDIHRINHLRACQVGWVRIDDGCLRFESCEQAQEYIRKN